MTSYLHEIQSNIIDLCSDSAWLKKDGQHFYRPHGTIFRGEEKRYPHVSSTLYRHLEETVPKWKEWKDGDREAKILECEHSIAFWAQSFLGEIDTYFSGFPPYIGENPCWQEIPEETKRILAEVRHNGGKTNFIDFSMDINVALFFACYSATGGDCDGRVILYHPCKNKNMHDGRVFPKVTHSDNQRSILVRPDYYSYSRNTGGQVAGILHPDDYDVVIVPRNKKQQLLLDLWKYHGIRPELIYRSLSGFIANQDLVLPQKT